MSLVRGVTSWCVVGSTALSMMVAGCAEERVVGTRWGVIGAENAAASAPRDEGPTAEAAKAEEGGWAIALDRITGPDHRQRAEVRRADLATRSTLKNVWTHTEGEQTYVFYGRYKDTSDDIAQRDMIRWRQLAAAGVVQIQVAMLVPIVVAPEGKRPEWNLRNTGGRGIYTLQVAVFEGATAESRGKAEAAVEELRGRKLEAYYYHGPTRSMVTIGLFGEKDIVDTPQGQNYSPRVQQLRQQFPYNTLNALQPPPGGPKPQPSVLVRVP